MTKTTVRRVVAGNLGPAVPIGAASNELTLAGGATSAVDAILETQDNGGQLVLSHSADGTAWSAPQVLATGGAHDDPRASVGPDGGGVTVWAAGSGDDAAIEVAGFGSAGPTGQLGLGGVGGGSGPIGGGDGSTSCTTVHMGDIDALSEAGCFLRDPQHPVALHLQPRAQNPTGVRMTPARARRLAIDTTGAISGISRQRHRRRQLWHGELRVSSAQRPTARRCSTSTPASRGCAQGFPIDGKIDIVPRMTRSRSRSR